VNIIKIRILDKLRSSTNGKCNYLIEMYDYFKFRNHVAITFELLGQNLYDFIMERDLKVTMNRDLN